MIRIRFSVQHTFSAFCAEGNGTGAPAYGRGTLGEVSRPQAREGTVWETGSATIEPTHHCLQVLRDLLQGLPALRIVRSNYNLLRLGEVRLSRFQPSGFMACLTRQVRFRRYFRRIDPLLRHCGGNKESIRGPVTCEHSNDAQCRLHDSAAVAGPTSWMFSWYA